MIIKFLFLYSAQLVKVALPLLFIPLIINIVGIQQYALVSFLMLLLSLLGLIDAGIYGGIVRVISTSKDNYYDHKGALLLWNKVFHYVISVCLIVASAFFIFSDIISTYWIKSDIDKEFLERCLLIIGLITSFSFAKGYLISKFVAYEKHVQLSVFQTLFIILQYCSAYFCLKELSNTVDIYFYVLAAFSLFETILLFSIGMHFSAKQNSNLISNIESHLRLTTSFNKKSLKDFLFSSFSLSSLTILWTITSQADKAILSGSVDSITFSYYQIASQAALCVNFLIMPLNQYLMPRLSNMFSNGNNELLNKTWFIFFFYFAFIVALFSPLYFFFGKFVLSFWLSDSEISDNVHIYLKWLFAASIVQAATNFLFIYYYAVNKLKLHFIAYLIYCLVVLPSIYLAINKLGPEACSILIMILSVSFLLIWGSISIKFHIQYFRYDLLFLIVGLFITSFFVVNLFVLFLSALDPLLQILLISMFYFSIIFLIYKNKNLIHVFLGLEN